MRSICTIAVFRLINGLLTQALPPQYRVSVFCHGNHVLDTKEGEKNCSQHISEERSEETRVEGFEKAEQEEKCISMKGVVFSTEGHVFLANAAFRLFQQRGREFTSYSSKKYLQCKAHK